MLFEHLIFNQIIHSGAACDKPLRVSSYRTEHGAEVDFILEFENEVFAIEVKASPTVRNVDLRGLKSFAEYYGKKHHPVVLYLGSLRKKIQKIDVLPWQTFLKEIGL